MSLTKIDWHHRAMKEGYILVDAHIPREGNEKDLCARIASRPATIAVVKKNYFWKFDLMMQGHHQQVVSHAEKMAINVARSMFPNHRIYTDHKDHECRELGIYWVPREKLWIFEKIWKSPSPEGKIVFQQRYPTRGWVKLEGTTNA